MTQAILLITCLFLSGGLADHVSRIPSVCKMPFTYMGREWNECIGANSARPWCSTNEVYNGSWVYCEVEKDDQITESHFLKLIQEAELQTQRLNSLKTKSGGGEKCKVCLDKMTKIAESVDAQKRIFLDQNKRLISLEEKASKLNEILKQLRKYHQLRFCREEKYGADYLGHRDHTEKGRACQPWTSNTPHDHPNKRDSQFPENSAALANNYCRNPDLSERPWCYTTDSKTRWEFCTVPICNKDCKVSEDENSGLPFCDAYPVAKCPAGWTYYEDSCYIAEMQKEASWEDAEKACVALSGHLASIHNHNENKFVGDLFAKKTTKKMWIGASDRDSEGQWKWTDGTAWDYSYWHTGEPNNYWNEDCLLLNWFEVLYDSWNDFDCRAKSGQGYVCKKSAI